MKHSGVKGKNIKIAEETMAILKDKKYALPSGECVDISDNLDFAMKNTELYQIDNNLIGFDFETDIKQLEVVNEKATQTAARLMASGKTDIVALNFASAVNVGGGFLRGSSAQEEDLCRASGLYPCINANSMQDYYINNINSGDQYYTDDIIYSPEVPFFRDEYNNLLPKPFNLSIITCPAPNVSSMVSVDVKRLEETFYRRAFKILTVAAFANHKHIVLGAWGCGAFGNDANMVANAFLKALKLTPVFETVSFAVYDTREPPVVFETFKKAICNV